VPHPDYLMGLLTPRQLIEWRAFATLEPFGEEADYWRAGLIAAATLNPHRTRGRKVLTPEDMMPNLYDRKSAGNQSVSDMRETMVAGMNAQKRKRQRGN